MVAENGAILAGEKEHADLRLDQLNLRAVIGRRRAANHSGAASPTPQ